MKRTKKFSWKNFWTLFFAALANLMFFLTLWLSTKYDKVSFDQIIYQTRASTVGSNTQLVGSAVIRVGLFTILAVLLNIFLFFLFSGRLTRMIKKIFKSDEKYLKMCSHKVCVFIMRHLFPVALACFFLSSTFFIAKLDVVTYIDNITTDSTFIEDVYVDPGDVDITFPEQKRNLIYIMLESLENTFGEPAAGGPIKENYMPELTALANNNINFSHDADFGGALSYHGTTWTAAAMVTQTSGVIMQVPPTGPSYSGDNPYMPGLTNIGEILGEAGYSNTLLIGSHADFHDRGDYFEDNGNYDIIDTESLKAEGRLDKDYWVWWGYEDEKLFQYAKEELTRLGSQDQPFNFTMLTCDTHFPNGYVCDRCEDLYGAQYPNVVRCSSRQIEEFILWIQAQPFYENTTIVISGDHLTMDPNFMKGVDKNYQRTIYNCIINAPDNIFDNPNTPEKEALGDPDCSVQIKNRLFGTFDMMPTTLAALGVTIEGNRLGLGTNLFSTRPTLTEEYGFDYVDLEFQRNSDFYNKKFLGMD